MPWYHYSGTTVCSIQIKKGVSVAVRPGTKVEIEVMGQDGQALASKGLLRRTGAPRTAPMKVEPVDVSKIKEVTVASGMASSIAEKGVTTSASLPPIPAKGREAEFTSGEILAVDAEDPTALDGESVVADDADADSSGFLSKKRRNK